MIISEEEIAASHTGISFKDGVRVQPSNDSWGAGVLSRQRRLSTDAEQIGDQIPVDEVSEVGRKPSGSTIHVKALSIM